MSLTMFLLQTTAPLLTQNITNSTNPAQLLQAINSSVAIGGYLGFGISMMVFILFFIIFSFRIRVLGALVVAAWFGLISALIGVAIGITTSTVVFLFVGITILGTILAVTEHILHPFD